MNSLNEQSRALMQQLTLQQKILIGGVSLGALVLIFFLVSMMSKPTYVTLFTNLHPQDASKIVDRLKEKKVSYKLEDDGKTVLVPKDQLYDLRLSMAGEGLLQSSTVGYEIFDKTNLGASDFVQKLNYRRALEGELARTIITIDEVEGARVHIVIPEKTLFKEDQKNATASVVLKLRGQRMKSENVDGIAHLVSSSVEGMDSKNVTIMDSRGDILSNNSESNSLASLSSTQYELQHKVENYLAQKAQSMLDGIVGNNNSIVRVTAELNFNQVERTTEQYDPDGQVIRSEQATEEKSVMSDSLPPSTRSNAVTNYEINKTIDHLVQGSGNINRLTVAVLINGVNKKIEVNGKQEIQYEPRPAEQVTQLTDIVKRAVGFDLRRNDEISFVNLPFDNRLADEEFVQKPEGIMQNERIVERVVLIAAMVAAAVILFMLIGRIKSRRVVVGNYFDVKEEYVNNAVQQISGATRASRKSKEEMEAEIALQLEALEDADIIPTETLVREERKKRVVDYVKDRPADASKVIKLWLQNANG